MKKLTAIFSLAACLSALGQSTQERVLPTTSLFSRQALTNETWQGWYSILQIPLFLATSQTTAVSFPYPISLTNSQNVIAGNGGALTGIVYATQAGSVTNSANLTNLNAITVTSTNFTGSYLNFESALSNAWPTLANPLWPASPTPILAYNNYYDDNGKTTLYATSLLAIAQSMQTNGMLAAGWKWIWMDDGWPLTNRDAYANLVPDPVRFPNGMPAFVQSIHNLGMKVGIYIARNSDTPSVTCFGLPGSTGPNFQRDLNQFAAWGIDGVKIDTCNLASYTLASAQANQFYYRETPNVVVKSGRSMAIWWSVEFGLGATGPVPSEVANEMNTISIAGTADPFINAYPIALIWTNALYAYTNSTSTNLYTVYGPGHFPYVGSVEPGGWTANTFLNFMSMLAVLPASSATANVTTTPSILQYYTNAAVFAAQQDPGGLPGYPVYRDANTEVWVRPMGYTNSMTNLVALVNRDTGSSHNVTLNWSYMSGVANTNPMVVQDLWSGVTYPAGVTSFTTNLAASSVALVKVYGPAGPSVNGAGITNLWETITPEQYGAVGDGVHDDSAAIQAVFDANNASMVAGVQTRVKLTPVKTYLVTTNIQLHRFMAQGNAHPWSITGGGTTRTFTMGAGAGFIDNDHIPGAMQMQGVTFYATNITTNIALTVANTNCTGTQNLFVKQCGFQNFQTALLLTNMDELNMQECTIFQCSNIVRCYSPSCGVVQVGDFQRIYANTYGEAMYLEGQNFSLIGCDIGGLETNAHVLHVGISPNGAANVTMMNCNCESVGNDPNHFNLFVDTGYVDIQSCNMLTGGNGAAIGLTNGGTVHIGQNNNLGADAANNVIRSYNSGGLDRSWGQTVFLTNSTLLGGVVPVYTKISGTPYSPVTIGNTFGGYNGSGVLAAGGQSGDLLTLEGDGGIYAGGTASSAANIVGSISGANLQNAFVMRFIQETNPTSATLELGSRWSGSGIVPSMWFRDNYSGGNLQLFVGSNPTNNPPTADKIYAAGTIAAYDIAFTNQLTTPTLADFTNRFGTTWTVTNWIMRPVTNNFMIFGCTNGGGIFSKQLAP